MKYLVLYKVETTTGMTRHQYVPNTYYKADIPTWEEFDDKERAIKCARENNGVIVEAFEFDIKKGVK